MAYVKTFYETDDGPVVGIRVSPEVLSAQPSQPPTAATAEGTAKVSRHKNSYGLRPRGFRLVRQTGTSPDLVNHYKFFPVLVSADFGTIKTDKAVTIAGVDWKVIAAYGESWR